MTSIIMQCYDFNGTARHMTYYSLANIIKYTDQPYELIVVDNEPKFPIDDGYGIIQPALTRYIINNEDVGCFASYNQGAEKATGDVLVFIQNDVFVNEGWLPAMRYYIDKGLASVVYPDQVPRSRDFIKSSYKLKPEDAMFGGRDAGLMMITRHGFDKIGGWNEKIKTSIVAWKDVFERIDKANLVWTDTCKTMIAHIMAGSNLMKDPEQYNKELKKEEEIMYDSPDKCL